MELSMFESDVKKVILFRPKPSRVSLIRIREKALEILLPKFLGILCECGTLDGGVGAMYGKVTAHMEDDIELGGFLLGRGRFGVHAYAPTARLRQGKVFSAHIGSFSVTDPRMFRYWGGHCGILSWKRGQWENRVAAHTAAPRTFAHVLTAGLTRPANR
jgi:hypothetical protein